MTLPSGTHMGTVTLTAREAPELAEFYVRVVGLQELGREGTDPAGLTALVRG